MYEQLNTQQLISRLTGKNKSFIKRVSNTQENKYGNVDVFSASIETVPTRQGDIAVVKMGFGENWIDFYFDYKGDVYETLGNGQGHKYHKSLEACAKELLNQAIKTQDIKSIF